MSLQVANLNALDGFGNGSKVPELLAAIEEINPDVAVFPEAYSEDAQHRVDAVCEDLEKAGYTTRTTLYGDIDGREDRHGLLVIGREGMVESAEVVRMTSRNAIRLAMIDPSTWNRLDFFGFHLDDRHEATRMTQAHALLQLMDAARPTIAAGDYNATHRDGMLPRVLRTVGPHSAPFGTVEPGIQKPKLASPEGVKWAVKRVGSLGTRLGEMATGSTIALFTEAGFEDADQAHKTTMSKRLPLAQLDHIMVRDARVKSFTRHGRTSASDHLPVSALVEA